MKFDPDTFVAIFLYLVLALGTYIVGNLLLASGNVNYCYIEQNIYNENSYDLKGNIPWRHNIDISKVKSLDEGIAQANKLHCKLWSTK